MSVFYPWVRKIPMEKGMATHSSILGWRISWTEEPGGLQSVGHKESDTTERLTHTHTHTHMGSSFQSSSFLSSLAIAVIFTTNPILKNVYIHQLLINYFIGMRACGSILHLHCHALFGHFSLFTRVITIFFLIFSIISQSILS